MYFRGYLQSVNSPALAYAGNDARIDPTKNSYQIGNNSLGLNPINYQGGNRAAGYAQQYVDSLYKQYQQQQGQQSFQAPNLLAGGGGASPSYAAVAPNWDIGAIYNSAGGAAASSVNPYYTSQLQQFQNNQAQAKAIQDQQRQLTLKNLQDSLTNQLQTNDTSRVRTGQDVLQNEQQIGQAADYRQADQGQQFDQDRLAQAKAQAVGGLTGSGLGEQQTLQAQTTHNVQEQRQGAQDQQQVAAQELTKARTFEDLANSDVLSKSVKAKGEQQSQIDWDKFVQGQTEDARQTTDSLEQQRLAKLSATQKDLARQQLQSMISALSNPAQRLAAAQQYGNSF